MFNQLIESKRAKKRSPGSTAFSVILHAVLIAGAAVATAHAAIENEKPKAEKVTFVNVKKDEPPPPKKEPPPPPPKNVTVAPPPPKGFQVLTAPPVVPVKIPEIDLSKKVTDAADFSGKGVAGGISKGVVGGTGPVPTDNQTYFSFQVEKQAEKIGGPSPDYPETLRSAGIQGEVQVQFVVDVDGRADMNTFKVLSSTNELFTAAVRRALPRMRFAPAEVGGKKVRQLVQLPFTFNLNNG